MHFRHLEPWQHEHRFDPDWHPAEQRTRLVFGLTAVTTILEVVAGTVFGSLALLADGWHLATHMGAFGIAAGPQSQIYVGEVGVLGDFTRAIALAIALASGMGLLQPQSILKACWHTCRRSRTCWWT